VTAPCILIQSNYFTLQL